MSAETSVFQHPVVSGSPHIHGPESVAKIMWGVVIALLPALAVSVYYFGLPALKTVSISVAACISFEWLIQKFMLRKACSLPDGSAVITGLLLAFNLPASLPWWMTVIGAAVAIGLAKMAYGGLGNNPFNPALVGRVFLLISFPVAMTTYPAPHPIWETGETKTAIATEAETAVGTAIIDATSGPTPLSLLKEARQQGRPMDETLRQIQLNHMQMLTGGKGGSLGEVSVLAILLGGLFLLWRRIITWHIPVAFIGSAFVFAAILHAANPQAYLPAGFSILSGGLMLGAIFMATDMVTSPMTPWGKIIFGLGCGILTILIRNFGAYPEGVSFAILIMNAFVPLINRGFRPKRYGSRPLHLH